jgi:hypothetical protein
MISIREEIAIAMPPEVLWPIPKFLTANRGRGAERGTV